jgi:hypothetical protein
MTIIQIGILIERNKTEQNKMCLTNGSDFYLLSNHWPIIWLVVTWHEMIA